jgi:hypothetical protein
MKSDNLDHFRDYDIKSVRNAARYQAQRLAVFASLYDTRWLKKDNLDESIIKTTLRTGRFLATARHGSPQSRLDTGATAESSQAGRLAPALHRKSGGGKDVHKFLARVTWPGPHFDAEDESALAIDSAEQARRGRQ